MLKRSHATGITNLDNNWGTICSVGFGPEDATLACNQLGYRTYRRYGTVGQLGWVIYATCSGYSSLRLSLFTHISMHNCLNISYHIIMQSYRLDPAGESCLLP